MPTSIGEGAARGLETGLRIGQGFAAQADEREARRLQQQRQAQLDAQAAADRDFQRERQLSQDARLDRQDARQALMDERQQNLDAEQALGVEFADLQNEGRGLLEQYGGFDKVPADLGASYALRVKDTRGRLSAQRAKRYAPLVEEQRAKAAELWSRIQTGKVSIDDVPDEDLVTSLTAMTRRNVADWLPGKDGKPSAVQQAGTDFMTAAETGNEEMMLRAANVLFSPELMTGVGGPGRDGSEILSKRMVQLIPHPENPQEFTPLLEVKVRREDGKVGTYRAPVTVNRTSDPDDDIRTISIQEGLDRVGKMTLLAEALNQRGIVDRITAGQAKAGDGPKNFLEAYYATGGKKPEAKKLDIGQFEDFGGYKIHYLPDGRQVRINKTATPTSGGGGEKPSAEMRELDSALRAGVINADEHRQRRRDMALGIKPKGDPKPLNEGQSKANIFGSRMAEANAVLGEMAAGGVTQGGLINRMAVAVAGEGGDTATNWTQSAEQQQVTQAKRDFINAVLRRESGASISPAEFGNADKQYFPQPGDSKDVMARKARNRQLAIDTMLAEVPEDQRTPVPSLTGRTMGLERERTASDEGGAKRAAVQPGLDLGPSRVPARPRQPARPTNRAEFDALPSGTEFIDPQGQLRRKP